MSWEKVKLGEICGINMGKTPSRNRSDYWGEGHSWVSIADLKGSYFIENTKECITDKAVKESGIKIVPKGTLLYSFKLSIGKVAITAKDIYTNEAIVALPIINIKRVDVRYLYWAMQKVDFSGIGDKAVMGLTLNKEKLKVIEVPLPPLPIQKQIAEILDKADVLRRKDQLLLQKYDQLAQAIFIDMFGDPVKNEKGWEVQKANQLVKVIGGAAFKSEDYCNEGIPLIRIGTVNKGFFDRAQLAFLPISFLNSYKRYIVKSGDLLITLTGTVGKDDYGNVFTLSDVYDNYLLNQRVAKLDIFSKELKTDYFKYYLKQKEVKAELTGVSRGVRQANISNYDIYELDVPIPPTNLQEIFVKALITIWDAKNKLAENESTSLFQTLLQKAFKGELTTTEYA